MKDAKHLVHIENDLTAEEMAICKEVTDEFVYSKRQKPEGIIDKNTGYYVNYCVWAGGVKHNIDDPDPSEPGNLKKYINMPKDNIELYM